MKLVVHELQSTLVQKMTPTKHTSVVAVRPHLYRHNLPAGNLKVQITTLADELIGESELLAIEDLNPGANFAHGYYTFYVNAYLAKGTEYKIKLVSEDYTFDEAAYIGWCNGFDLQKYAMNDEPSTGLDYPLDLEVWERKVK